MDYAIVGLIAVSLVAAAVGTLRATRAKREQRTRHLSTYPSLEVLLALMDKGKYRQIRDCNGQTGTVRATRAILHDFPGITLKEAADVAKSLGT